MYVSLVLILIITKFLEIILYSKSSNTTMSEQKFPKKINDFANNVYGQLSGSVEMEPSNIVFSPYSIHTCLAMAMFGADGDTENEIKQTLGFNTCNKVAVADGYNKVLVAYENSNILRIANKIYVNEGLTIKDEYNDVMINKFLSKTDEIDFSKSEESTKTINDWVEGQTNNCIKNLIPAQLLNSETQMVLVNAIHFKGQWVNEFPKTRTKHEDFYVHATDVVQVDMMELPRTKLMYADLTELKASAIKMEYKDCDLFMLVLLPNDVNGLKELEEQLKTANMLDIMKRMKEESVNVKFPKFKAEYEVELAAALKELGINLMFSDQASFRNMLQNETPIKVSHVLHKAYIDVDEEGTEAAAATGLVATNRSATQAETIKYFIADHPFYYVIMNANGYQFFVGKYEKPISIEIPKQETENETKLRNSCNVKCENQNQETQENKESQENKENKPDNKDVITTIE